MRASCPDLRYFAHIYANAAYIYNNNCTMRQYLAPSTAIINKTCCVIEVMLGGNNADVLGPTYIRIIISFIPARIQSANPMADGASNFIPKKWRVTSRLYTTSNRRPPQINAMVATALTGSNAAPDIAIPTDHTHYHHLCVRIARLLYVLCSE